MKPFCPACRREIPLADVNVSTDVALCRRCEQTFSYAELIEDERGAPVELGRPPKGAWFHRDMSGFEVGVTTRSAGAFFLVPFMCVWSGFSLGGIYGSQIVKGEFSLTASLFGIPFVLGTLLFGSIAVMSVCGKVLVRVNRNAGLVFVGVGPLGWRRKFDWDGVAGIHLTQKCGNRGSVTDEITLEGRKRLSFASGVKAERLDFMLGALREMQRQRR
jgi:hypothetical protein